MQRLGPKAVVDQIKAKWVSAYASVGSAHAQKIVLA